MSLGDGAFTSTVGTCRTRRARSCRINFHVVPCDGLAFIILVLFLNIDNPKTPILTGLKAIDWLGSITIIGGTLMLLLGLEYGGVTYSWAAAIVICLIIFGGFTGVLFFLNEWKLAKYAIMPLRIFRRCSNLAAFGVCFCHGFILLSAFFFLPIYFQAVVGATPILSGVYLLPYVLSLSFTAIATGIFMRITGRFVEPIQIGLLLMTLGVGLFMDLPSFTSWPRIIMFQIIAGLGTGPNFQAPLIALQVSVAPGDVATATATFSFMRQFSTAISVVVGSVIFQNQMQSHHTELLRSGVSPQFVSMLTGGGATALTTLVRDLPVLQRNAVIEAYTQCIQKMWILYVCVGAVGILLSMAIQARELSRHHEVVKTGLEAQEKYRLAEIATQGQAHQASAIHTSQNDIAETHDSTRNENTAGHPQGAGLGLRDLSPGGTAGV